MYCQWPPMILFFSVHEAASVSFDDLVLEVFGLVWKIEEIATTQIQFLI